MKYRDFTPEKRPVGLTCQLVKESGLTYRKRPGRECGGPFVDVVVTLEKKRLPRKRRAVCCAVIEPDWRRMEIYGDSYKERMLALADRLEARLKECPDELRKSNLRVEFLSHELKVF